ncbi:MAG: bifunctional [glutamate--ammonia ligase]-adenylyl-L-tyrosine phosphorylase/[glutamate--ammonia-ligase] adenylyltransferase [Zetaproteobacteria bacterium]|nr:MAG: bifunctional [glutamate--ammonia ligase]-adenylyl-L-tyrosine phosphorylase/[glutamate--ammonia-ligase] adenylyltransferase [Zetaproteobacteria bacterium]
MIPPLAAQLAERVPWFAQLLRQVPPSLREDLFADVKHARLPDASPHWLPPCPNTSLSGCMRHLRQCKQRALLYLIWWELGLHGDIRISWQAISAFADGLIRMALSMAEDLLAPRYGRLANGRFCVLGLGKLGGNELNLGSDIDLMFVWQGNGITTGGRQALAAGEYYSRLGRMLIRLLSEHDEHGQAWHVDMRLRPGGDTAPIALSLEATLDHYLEHGQTWERAMLIKARPVAGDTKLGAELIAGLIPFIYRRYLDYTTVAALADMKRRIDAQGGHRDLAPGFDIKRGRGGIREIEFTIQALQLLHGGRNPALRHNNSMKALAALAEAHAIDPRDADHLSAAYAFWRRVEHAVQARRGERTQKLPPDYANYLAQVLQEPAIINRMRHHAAQVARIFAEVILPMDAEAAPWLGNAHPPLGTLPDAQRTRIMHALAAIDSMLKRGLLPERSRQQVERILSHAMPHWLRDANGVQAVEAFAELIHHIAGRATWIDMLATHAGALRWLTGVLAASRYLAQHIARDPSWLEWPLMHQHTELDISDIVRSIAAIDVRDGEQARRKLARWCDRGRLLCALAIDAHTADALTVSNWLADIADAASRLALRLCAHELGLDPDFPLVAVALGKHGSREMGLTSDLDMVFVLVDSREQAMPAHARDAAQRLGRRMISVLSQAPPFGAGFAFDARLRPSGHAGALVTTLHGFIDYQWHHAQLWEHQALCRARPVAGPDVAQTQVAQAIRDILAQPRDRTFLMTEMRAMREKMIKHLASKTPEEVNLKHDPGGMVDIEFLAQFARLAFGGCAVGTCATLLGLPAALPAPRLREARWLAATYAIYRAMDHALCVELWHSVARIGMHPEDKVWTTCRRHTPMHSPRKLRRTMRRVHRIFHTWLQAGAWE